MSKNVIILAAGRGTRMNSDLPKVCHSILDKPMINYIVDTFSDFNKYIVVGYQKEQVMDIVKKDVTYVIQDQQLGTGHAVRCVTELKGKDGITVVVNGDLPFVKKETIDNAISKFIESNAQLVLLTTNTTNPGKAGRVVMGTDNSIKKIVEFKDATDVEKQMNDINVGLYVFNNSVLFELIEEVTNSNAQQEYYLTDLIELLINRNMKVVNYSISNLESLSCNDKLELSNMESLYKKEIIKSHLLNGVSISIDNVTIGPDVMLEPGVVIKDYTYITGSVVVKEGSTVGPFARIRDKTNIGKKCLIGNFVEIKNSNISDNCKISHHSYIGDAVMGANTNIGCGVITANYDGVSKHKTIIGNDCFIGSNVTLVAPVTIGNGAFIAAGSVVSKDIETNMFAIERAELKIKNKK